MRAQLGIAFVIRLTLVLSAALPIGIASALTPNDASYALQWYMKNSGGIVGSPGMDIHIESAWDRYVGSSTDKIGILDRGVVFTNNNEFQARLHRAGLFGNLPAVNPLPQPTSMAGIAAATGNNYQGIAGINWNAQIYSYEMDPENVNQFTNAMDWFRTNSVRQLAIGWRFPDSTSTGAFGQARLHFVDAFQDDILTFVAAPNASEVPSVSLTKFALEGVVPVATIAPDGDVLSNAVQSNFVEFAVPIDGGASAPISTDVYGSVSPQNHLGNAAAAAAGIASLIRGRAEALGTSLVNDDVLNIMRISAIDVLPAGKDTYTGYGRLDASAALDLLQAPNVMRTGTAVGGTDMGVSGDWFVGVFDGWGLPPTMYQFRQHTVERDIVFPQAFGPVKGVWIRRNQSVGAAPGGTHLVPYAEVVPGSMTSTGCRLRTYVYEVLDLTGHAMPNVLYPSPNQVTFAFVVLGVPAPLEATISGSTSLWCHNYGTWSVNTSGGTGQYTYAWRYWIPSDGWSGIESTSPSYSREVGYAGMMPGTSFSVKCDITSGSEALTKTLGVSWSCDEGSGGGEEGGGGGGEILPCPRPCFATGARLGLVGGVARGVVRLNFYLPRSADAELRVFDVSGREIGLIAAEPLAAGSHSTSWDTRRLAAGVYLVRLQVGAESAVLRAVVVR